MKCDITGCGKEMETMSAFKPRADGALYQDTSDGRAYMICNDCRKKLGLMK